MDKIEDVHLTDLNESKYIRTFRVQYKQDGIKKSWDCIKVHDSVCILIHHIERDSFIFIRQFRPAVYIAKAREQGQTGSCIDTTKLSGEMGITYELCAGIVDKEGASLEETAQAEVLEECGYDIPLDKLEKITTARSGVGISGPLQTIYYAPVTEAMKKTDGGGCPEEGELIYLEEVPTHKSLSLLSDESIERPVAMLFAIMWFHMNKATSPVQKV